MADFIAQHHHTTPDDYIGMVRRLYMGFGWGTLEDPAGDNIGGNLTIRVNHGRWIIDCPTCRAAQVAEFESPYFMCVECANKDNDGKWWALSIPANYRAIEAALLARPMGVNPGNSPTRSWDPTETVEELLEENKINGVEG